MNTIKFSTFFVHSKFVYSRFVYNRFVYNKFVHNKFAKIGKITRKVVAALMQEESRLTNMVIHPSEWDDSPYATVNPKTGLSVCDSPVLKTLSVLVPYLIPYFTY